jgi:hypothetical protein
MQFNDMTAQAQEEGFIRGMQWEYLEKNLKSLADRYHLVYNSPEKAIKDIERLRKALLNTNPQLIINEETIND